MKTCLTCKTAKERSEFHKSSRTPDGLYSHCIPCRKVLDQKYYQKTDKKKVKNAERVAKIQAWVNEYKSLRGCVVCKENTTCCLDFHHLENKEFNISNGKNCSNERLMAEVAKCVVICANCHRKVHAGLINLGVPADSGSGSTKPA